MACQHKSEKKCQVLQKQVEGILEDSIISKTSWIVFSEWSTSGENKTKQNKRTNNPPKKPQRNRKKEKNNSLGREQLQQGRQHQHCPPHPCLAQTACPALHYFPLGQSLFSSQWLCFGFVLKTLLITVGCFHYC